MILEYIVTGTGRCGTVAVARYLTQLGIDCGHESIFDFNGLDTALNRIYGRHDVTISLTSRQKWDGSEHHEDADWVPELKSLQADSSYMAAPFLDHEDLEELTIIHLIRNPIRVVDSFLNHFHYFQGQEPGSTIYSKPYEEFIYKHVPELCLPMSAAERACLYVVRWNEMIDRRLRYTSWVVKVEDGLAGIAERIGLDPLPEFPKRHQLVPEAWGQGVFP
jgi:hypothetical protein